MHVDAVRRFNRFYTRRVGALRAGLLGSPHPLPEARLIYEIGRRGECSAAELARDLDLDAGYLSRLLQGLKRRGLLSARRSARDARARVLALTAKGSKTHAQLDARSRDEVAGMLGGLGGGERERLVGALRTVESLLEKESAVEARQIALRAHRPGDMGWVIGRHGAVYAAEYGWDQRFEALVAEIAAKFIRSFDPARERCWIAELDGEPVGSAFVVKQSASVAKLRLLLVEPRARGLGLGRRLVRECIAFARAKGYRKLVLWTQANLTAARGLYKAEGFGLVSTEKHRSFGARLTGEYWELKL
jgi:DNA-binding MarR family transcriptional regulator/N-acetylglutamate synthase-like GNAT family acetyltransferase